MTFEWKNFSRPQKDAIEWILWNIRCKQHCAVITGQNAGKTLMAEYLKTQVEQPIMVYPTLRNLEGISTPTHRNVVSLSELLNPKYPIENTLHRVVNPTRSFTMIMDGVQYIPYRSEFMKLVVDLQQIENCRVVVVTSQQDEDYLPIGNRRYFSSLDLNPCLDIASLKLEYLKKKDLQQQVKDYGLNHGSRLLVEQLTESEEVQ